MRAVSNAFGSTERTGAFGASWAPAGLAVLRIVVALLFIEHGMEKLFSIPAAPSFHNPAPFTLLWYAAVLELFGGVFVLLGFVTRPVAFLLSGEMAVAYWMAHAPRSPFPAVNGGDAAVLFCFVFLYLAVAGPGAFSVDGSWTPARR